MVKCKKARMAIPKHKEKKKTIKYGLAYEGEGLEDQNLRENYGQITKSVNCAFSSVYIELAYSDPSRVLLSLSDITYFIKRIICAIDPNGGGKNRTAIWFGYLNTRLGEVVVSFFFKKKRRILKKFLIC